MGAERLDPQRVAAGVRALCYSQDNGDTWHGFYGRHKWLDVGKVVRLVLQADEDYRDGVTQPEPRPIRSPYPLEQVTHWQETFDAAMRESAGFIGRRLNGDAPSV